MPVNHDLLLQSYHLAKNNAADAASHTACDSKQGEHDQSSKEIGTRFFSLCSALAFVRGVPVNFRGVALQIDNFPSDTSTC